jgi:CheY-like chemotaxis protein
VPQKPPPNTSPGNNSKLILIGEDDPDDKEFLQEIFSSIDGTLSFLFAINGSHVLDYLKNCDEKQLPCLILLDYNMPELNGAEILKELKRNERCRSIPKIIWSTSQSNTYKDLCLELGADEYIVKPSSMNALVEICRHMLSFCR